MKTLIKLLTITFILFYSQFSVGQTQIYILDFESAGGYTTTPAEFTDGDYDYFIRTDGSNISTVTSWIGTLGSFYFGAQDTDADQATTPCVIDISNIDITGYNNLEFRVYLAEDDATDGAEDWDASHYVHFDYDIDNSSTFTNLLHIESEGGTNTLPKIDDDFDGTGEGTTITNTFTQFTRSISGTGTDLDLKITINLLQGDVDIAIDHIEIYGTDTNSEAYDSGSQPTSANIASTSTAFTDVFEIEIEDVGATGDNLPTSVTNIRVKPHTTNTADWTDHINSIKLNNGADITLGTVDITDTYIDIAIPAGNLDIANGTSDIITLQVQIKNTGITDNAILSFMVDADNHGFTADQTSGSTFSNTFTLGDFNSEDFIIDVTATKLLFVEQPTNTEVNQTMSPAVTIQATDENGNRDLDNVSVISLSSDGTMNAVSNITLTNGFGTFGNIIHTVEETNLTLTASDGSLTDATSSNFDITEELGSADDIIISEMCDPANNFRDDRYIEIFNPTSLTIDLTGCKVVAIVTGTTEILTWNLSGTIAPCEALTCGDDASTITHDFSVANWTTSNTSWNGDNDGAYYENSSGTIIDKAYVSTNFENSSIIRNSDISSPNTTFTSSEWTVTAVTDAGTGASTPGTHINDGCGIICEEPTNHASSITFDNIASNSLTINWTVGNGANRIIVAKENVPVDWSPTDNNTYIANSSFGSGTELGTGNYVVYNGNSNTVDITNLTPGATYHFKIFEYGCNAGSEDYLISGTPATNNETTLPENVTDLQITCITNTTATLTWTLPVGNFDGILIAVRNSTLTTSDPSCEGSTLSSPNTDFSAASVYCSNGTDSRYVYNATGTSVTITGLTPGADYVFKAFTYEDALWSDGTQVSEITEVQNVTSVNTTPANTQMNISWVNPTTCYDEIMVVAHQAGSVTETPSGDGTAYTADAAFASGTNMGGIGDYVVYKGVGTTVNITALTDNTEYCFKIFTRKGNDWSSGVEACAIPTDVTVFKPGELIIVGFDSNTGNGNDRIFLATLVDIKPGTKFLYVNSRFESGAAANTRTMEWHGGGDDPDADPGIFEIVYSSSAISNISAGSIIYFETTGASAFDLEVDGTANSDLSSNNISNSANIHASDGDQVWLIQGTFTDQGDHHLLDGYCLWGLSNNKAWVPITNPVSDIDGSAGRESRVHPDLECFNMELPDGKGWAFYENQATHDDTKRNLLLAIMNADNWQDGVGDDNMNFDTDYNSPYADDKIGRPFTLTIGDSDGTWVGGAIGNEEDWFDCRNWEGLAVPNQETNVKIPNVTNSPDIDNTSTNAPKYSNFAECLDLDIDGETLNINGDTNDTLYVHGDLLIQNSGILDMDDASKALDGIIYIWGDWNNQSNFKQGEGTVVFMNTDAQSITANSGTENFYNLILNNTYANGVLMNDNIIIENEFSQTDNSLDLNTNNIEIQGQYTATNSFFIGDVSSNMTINGTGNLADIYFKSDFNLYDFTINRNGKNANLMTDLYFNNDLTITDGSVTLNATKNYDVVGTLTNTPNTAAALILKSDASGTASLIHNNAVPATCERYLNDNKWHFYQTPLNNANIDILTTTSWGEDNPNFFWYNEAIADYWQGTTLYEPTGWTAPAHTGKLLTDRGYIHLSTEAKTYSVEGGTLENNDKTFSLSYNDSGSGTEPVTSTDWDEFEGWNLIGNPYTSALNWDDVWTNFDDATEKTYLENGIYYYDPTQSKYVYYGGGTMNNLGITINGGSQMIPANQAFFVKTTTSGNADVVINKSARAHSSQTFWKKEKDIIPNLIRLNIEQNGYTDETVIRTHQLGTEMHDYNLDAYKMFVWDASKPQIYTTSNQKANNFSVNTIAEIVEHKTVPISIYTGIAGEYAINLTENYFENTHIWLEDKLKNSFTNFNNTTTYPFSQGAENNENRFVLHFDKNHAPNTQIELMNKTIFVDADFKFELPNNTFYDVDEFDQLTISTTNLPEWLTFENGNLYGTAETAGQYQINFVATDFFGEQAQNGFIINVIKNATDIINLENNISIYPNPTTGTITVKFANQINGKITIVNIAGQTVKQKNINTNNIDLDLSNFAKGIYFINVKSENQVFIEKIILK